MIVHTATHTGELVWVRAYNTRRACIAQILRAGPEWTQVQLLSPYYDWDHVQHTLQGSEGQTWSVENYRLEILQEG